MDIAAALIGIVVGFVVGVTSTGGGALLTPLQRALGFASGVRVSTTSVGSGSLRLCVLAFFFPLPAPVMVGTDLVHALLLSVVATLGHLHAGRVDFTLAGSVLAGSVPGVLLGARLAHAVPERALRATLALVLIGLGLPIAWPGAFTHVQLG